MADKAKNKTKTVDQYLQEGRDHETERSYWLNQWQLVSEYVHHRRADFTTSKTPGAFISSHLWTDDPSHMAETSSSALLGYMWSNGVESFKLKPNATVFGKDKDAMKWFAESVEIMQSEMKDQEAGLAVALDEVMLDIVTLGTAAVFGEERNVDEPQLGCLSFEPWSIQSFSLAENAAMRATKFHRTREYTVDQLAEKYGVEELSAPMKKAYDDGQMSQKFKILHVVEDRDERYRSKNSEGAKDMPVASVHIDPETKEIIKESGYPIHPVACARLSKRMNESYGRGRGINALPSIMMLNQVWEDLILAMEKKLDPPMYQLNDAVTGNGTIETSAGAINILRVDKAMPNVSPTGKLFDIQDTRDVVQLIDKLQDSISNHFMIDRLINLNNDTQMTKGEAFLRNSIRQATLRSIVSRLFLELFDPLINNSFMICLQRGKFGFFPGDEKAQEMEERGTKVKYIPDSIVEAIDRNENLYNIEYLTPAARDMQSEEGQGMIEMLGIAAEGAQMDEELRHRVDWGWTLNRLTEIKGANRRMWRDEKEFQKRVDQGKEGAQGAEAAAMMQSIAGASKDDAQAQALLAQQ